VSHPQQASVGNEPADRSAATRGEVVPSSDPDDIQRDIDRTRAELASAIDAIADRVSPKRLADRGKKTARSKVAGVREAVSRPSSGPTSGDEPSQGAVSSSAAHTVEGGLASVAGSPPPHESITGPGNEDRGSAGSRTIALPGGNGVPVRWVVLGGAGVAVLAAVVGVLIARRAR
jgi:hypothetical protein